MRDEPRSSLSRLSKHLLAVFLRFSFLLIAVCVIPALVSVSRLPVCPECLSSLEPIRAPNAFSAASAWRRRNCSLATPNARLVVTILPKFESAVSFARILPASSRPDPPFEIQRRIPAAEPLGELLARSIEELPLAAADSIPVLVPVPLHSSKRRERRFNQSELIARAA